MRMNPLRNAVRWLISRAANLTPEVVYYAEGWPAKINDKMVSLKSQDGDGRQSVISTAAIAMSCAMHEALPNIGDTATINLTGVTQGGREIGHFVVTAKRVEEQP